MNALEAIHGRASVRSFRYRTIDDAVILQLLEAAVRAPTAHGDQPWAFVVIEDRVVLRQISDRAKELWRQEAHPRPLHEAAGLPANDPLVEGMWKHDHDLLYGAGALILIGTRATSGFAEADCWLAAQNLLLAAHAVGLGGCVVTSVLGALRTPEIRRLHTAPPSFRPIVPIVVGAPKEPPRPGPRRPPEVLAWQK